MPWVWNEDDRADVGIRAVRRPQSAYIAPSPGMAPVAAAPVVSGRARLAVRILVIALLAVIAACVVWIALEQHYQSCVQASTGASASAPAASTDCRRPF